MGKKGAKKMSAAAADVHASKSTKRNLVQQRVDLDPEIYQALDAHTKRIGLNRAMYIRMVLIADLRAKGVIE